MIVQNLAVGYLSVQVHVGYAWVHAKYKLITSVQNSACKTRGFVAELIGLQ